MRQRREGKARYLIGIAVDGASTFGRAVMRGAMRFINAQRRAEIYSQLRGTFANEPPDWPRCDGAIIAGVGGPLRDAILASSRHVVSCSGASDPSESAIVCLDDRAAGALAAEHLIDCRLQSFAYYGQAGMRHSINRHAGFAGRLSQAKHSCVTAPVDYPGQMNDRAHWPELTAWLQDLPKPIGLFALEDGAAFDIAAACHRANIAVPEQVAIIGVNNDDLLCEAALPPLSSVDAGFIRIGYEAARVLHRMMGGKHLSDAERHVRMPPLQVVRRMSSDILAVDQPDVADALRFIREHACDPCTVGDVAHHVAKGRRWLERQFVRDVGRTPGDEIARVQIQTAKRLLLQGTLPLPEIASRCGFAGASTFGRTFRRLEADTPAAFRRRSIRPTSDDE